MNDGCFEQLDLLFPELARANDTLVASIHGRGFSMRPLAGGVLASLRVSSLAQSGHWLAGSYHLRKYRLCSIDNIQVDRVQ